jgi:c-di-GMP-binding flagellar brake protein YcgR
MHAYQPDVDREKRQHFRLDTDIPCTVRLPKGEDVPAVIVNLSVGGIKFRCSRDTAHRLLPRDQRIPGQVLGVTIEVHFDLQSPERDRRSFGAMARVIHSERLAQDVFHVGVQFLDLDEADRSTLRDFIESNCPLQQS